MRQGKVTDIDICLEVSDHQQEKKMRFEIIYRYINEKFLDVRYEWARNESDALVKFWTFVRNFRDINNVEFLRIEEKPEC